MAEFNLLGFGGPRTDHGNLNIKCICALHQREKNPSRGALDRIVVIGGHAVDGGREE